MKIASKFQLRSINGRYYVARIRYGLFVENYPLNLNSRIFHPITSMPKIIRTIHSKSKLHNVKLYEYCEGKRFIPPLFSYTSIRIYPIKEWVDVDTKFYTQW